MDSIIAPKGVKAGKLYTTSPTPSTIISKFFIFLSIFYQFQDILRAPRLKQLESWIEFCRHKVQTVGL